MKTRHYKKVAGRKVFSRVELTSVDKRGIAAAEVFAQSLRSAYSLGTMTFTSASTRALEPISVMAGPVKKLRVQAQE